MMEQKNRGPRATGGLKKAERANDSNLHHDTDRVNSINPGEDLFWRLHGLARAFADGECSKLIAEAALDFPRALAAIDVMNGWVLAISNPTTAQMDAARELRITLVALYQMGRIVGGCGHASA